MVEFTPLEDQIRECFGRVVYTHKTHEKMAEDCAATLRHYKLAQIVVSVLTAISALWTNLKNFETAKFVTVGLSAVTIWLTGYIKGFDPGGSAQKHRDTAASLWPIREGYLSLLTDLRMRSIDDKEALKRRDQLESKLAAIYKGAPQTNAKAYSAAQKALKQDEEYTFSDSEIDKFVPSSLRKIKHADD
jgi:hypothetical protein